MNKEEYQIIQEGRSPDSMGRELSPWVEKFLLEYGDQLEGPLLEIGCGAGPALQYLHNKGLFVMGMDISRSSILNCINHHTTPLPAVLWDAQDPFPFPDKTFKTVLIFHALEHMEFPEKTLKEINRVLNGKFCSITPITTELDVPFGHFAIFKGEFKDYFSDFEILTYIKDYSAGALVIATNKK